LSCRISWITIVILSTLRMSTSGLAPWLSMIRRFWISVDSLKRPPTLLTIASSFSSSCIVAPPRLITLPLERLGQYALKLLHRRLQIVVDDLTLIFPGPFQLAPRRFQAPGQGLRGLAVANLQPLFVHLPTRQLDEDRQVIVV